MLAEKLSTPIYYLMLSIMILNLFQRKHMATGEKKRFATLWLAGTLLILQIEIGLLAANKQPDWMLIPAFALYAVILFLLRKKIFVFRRTCASCGAPLASREFIGRDDNLCATCAPTPEEEEKPEEEKKEKPQPITIAAPEIDEENRHTLGKGTPREEIPRDTDGIDWDAWEFAEKAVLCYLFRGDEVLLIHKKTGLGRGLVNAPGGRIEAAEMPIDAAIREMQEETGITPKELKEVASLHFIFTDGYSLKGTVFFAYDHEGEARATDEADPFWTPVGEIPFDKMWEDDALWLPKVLEGKRVTGYFIFEDEAMVSQKIIES